jgi:hypothetical protein
VIEDHLGVVDETGAAAERAHSRLWELLDRRSSRVWSARAGSWVRSTSRFAPRPVHSNLALIFPALAEGVQAPAALRPLFEIVAPLRAIQPSLACAPAADLERLLESRGLPLFGRPQWTPLADHPLWIVHLSEPLDLLGMLTVMHAAGVPARAWDRATGPIVIATGVGAMRAGDLARVFADAVLPLEVLDRGWFERWAAAGAAGLLGLDAGARWGTGIGGRAGALRAAGLRTAPPRRCPSRDLHGRTAS